MGADREPHRGTVDTEEFAPRFLHARLAGFDKDMRICLSPVRSSTRPGITHAYFPALGACCGLLEYMAGLARGNIRGIGWPQVADWAERFLVQPDYDRQTMRVLVEAIRHPVAHRGIASGVWIDHNQGPHRGRRLTWKVAADALRPAVRVVPENGSLTKDPPWPCGYTHRLHVHLRGLSVDLRNGVKGYADALAVDRQLQGNFDRAMRQLYPR
jgi:hypothetical protein